MSGRNHAVRGAVRRVSVLLSVITLLGVGCGKDDSAPVSYSAGQSRSSRGQSSQLQDYFPLGVSNKWEYKITIPKGGGFFTLNRHIGQGAPIAIGRKNNEGVSGLNYEILAKDGGSFRLTVLKDDLGLFDGSDEVYLDEYRTGDPSAGERYTAVDFRVVEHIAAIQSQGYRFPFCIRHMDTTLMYGGLADDAYLTILPAAGFHDTTVPAGVFRKCAKQSMRVRPEKLLTGRDLSQMKAAVEGPMYDGWKTESFFAPDVGLVRQEQFDLKGNSLNTMELTSYSVGGISDGDASFSAPHRSSGGTDRASEKTQGESLGIQGVVLEKRESLSESAGSRYSLVTCISVKNGGDREISCDRVVTVWYPFGPQGVKYVFDREYSAPNNVLRVGRETEFWDESPFSLQDRPQGGARSYELKALPGGLVDRGIGSFLGVGVFRSGKLIYSTGSFLPRLRVDGLQLFPSNVYLPLVNSGHVDLSNLKKEATPLQFGAQGAYKDELVRILLQSVPVRDAFETADVFNSAQQRVYTLRLGLAMDSASGN